MSLLTTYDEQWYGEEPFLQEWWDGWPIVKHPNDLMMYQEIIWQTQPELIIETGTYTGGSALFLAHMLDCVGPEDSSVITVDITVSPELPEHDRITFMHGKSSTDLRVLERLKDRARGKKTMVILDSDHRMNHVLKELKLYAPLVSKGCYLIVEDTHPLSVYKGEEYRNDGYPSGAIKKWNPASHGFEPDPRRERFLFSQNPGGYLRKVR